MSLLPFLCCPPDTPREARHSFAGIFYAHGINRSVMLTIINELDNGDRMSDFEENNQGEQPIVDENDGCQPRNKVKLFTSENNPGKGRPKGAKNKKTTLIERLDKLGIDPLNEFLKRAILIKDDDKAAAMWFKLVDKTYAGVVADKNINIAKTDTTMHITVGIPTLPSGDLRELERQIVEGEITEAACLPSATGGLENAEDDED